MQTSPKLVLLNGAVGVGKSTIAQKYIDDHPLTLSVDGDAIIAMIGQWTTHESTARELLFELTKSLVRTYLGTGHDVILPYVLTNATHAEAFETIATMYEAPFVEVLLDANQEEATRRLFERGSWGEPGAPPLVKEDLPIIDSLYNRMTTELAQRPNTIRIPSIKDEIEETYRRFCEVLLQA